MALRHYCAPPIILLVAAMVVAASATAAGRVGADDTSGTAAIHGAGASRSSAGMHMEMSRGSYNKKTHYKSSSYKPSYNKKDKYKHGNKGTCVTPTILANPQSNMVDTTMVPLGKVTGASCDRYNKCCEPYVCGSQDIYDININNFDGAIADTTCSTETPSQVTGRCCIDGLKVIYQFVCPYPTAAELVDEGGFYPDCSVNGTSKLTGYNITGGLTTKYDVFTDPPDELAQALLNRLACVCCTGVLYVNVDDYNIFCNENPDDSIDAVGICDLHA